MKKTIASFAILSLMLSASALAKPAQKFDSKELVRMGLFPPGFQPLTFMDEQMTLLALDEPTIEQKKTGVTQRVWQIKLDKGYQFVSSSHYDLKLPRLEQVKLTADKKSLLMSYKRGASLDKLDLATGKITSIMEHVQGQPGFRLDPGVIFSHAGKNYGLGYRYDSEDRCDPPSVGELDLTKSGAEVFVPLHEITPMHAGIVRLSATSIHDPEAALFVQSGKKGEGRVVRWTPALAKPEIVDTGVRYGGMWGEDEFGLFGMKHGNRNYDLILVNAKTGDKKVVAHSELPLTNPVLAPGGVSWAGLEEQVKGSFNIIGGNAKGKVVLDELQLPSVLRLGTLGQTVVSFSPGGLKFYKLP